MHLEQCGPKCWWILLLLLSREDSGVVCQGRNFSGRRTAASDEDGLLWGGSRDTREGGREMMAT